METNVTNLLSAMSSFNKYFTSNLMNVSMNKPGYWIEKCNKSINRHFKDNFFGITRSKYVYLNIQSRGSVLRFPNFSFPFFLFVTIGRRAYRKKETFRSFLGYPYYLPIYLCILVIGLSFTYFIRQKLLVILEQEVTWLKFDFKFSFESFLAVEWLSYIML